MRLSVNQLESLARKAAVGAGMDHGHAQEAAQALLHLTAAGFNGAPALVRALRAWSDGVTGPVIREWHEHTCRLRPSDARPPCILHAAPALSDFSQLASTPGRVERVEARDLADPGWAIGQFAVGPWPAGLVLHCFEPGGAALRWAVWPAGEDGLLTAAGDIHAPDPGDLVVAARAPGETRPAHAGPALTLFTDPQRLCERGVTIEPADHDALKHYFDLTLVPDSEASRRHGAGAGLVDSD